MQYYTLQYHIPLFQNHHRQRLDATDEQSCKHQGSGRRQQEEMVLMGQYLRLFDIFICH
jgi:hypothetical protein